jgi:hypothetical protein
MKLKLKLKLRMRMRMRMRMTSTLRAPLSAMEGSVRKVEAL